MTNDATRLVGIWAVALTLVSGLLAAVLSILAALPRPSDNYAGYRNGSRRQGESSPVAVSGDYGGRSRKGGTP